VLLVASVVMLWFGYLRATAGASAGDSRLAVGGAFLVALVTVPTALQAASRAWPGRRMTGTSRQATGYVLVGLAVLASVLAFIARAVSPIWHGTATACLAGVLAGLSVTSLLKAGRR
jgi:hypothetical protein